MEQEYYTVYIKNGVSSLKRCEYVIEETPSYVENKYYGVETNINIFKDVFFDTVSKITAIIYCKYMELNKNLNTQEINIYGVDDDYKNNFVGLSLSDANKIILKLQFYYKHL